MLEQDHAQAAAEAAGKFNPAETIIGHVANSHEHPLIHLSPIFGIDMSVTKHVFMLWLVAALVFVSITVIVRSYIRKTRLVPTGAAGPLELAVEFVRDSVVEPNLGGKWTAVWTPYILTVFLFILASNAIGLVPIFDVLGLIDHYVLHTPEHSFIKNLVHGSSTTTGNFNVTAGLAVISFFAIITAGVRKHGFVKHWTNLVPGNVPKALYILLIPLEIIGLFVRPFALTMRLAANMTGGHIALLAITSFVFIFAEMLGPGMATGIGLVFSLPLNVALTGLEIIVVLVQAYVFTLLTAVFMGMAVHAHH